jgi:hypothetical protein
MPRVVITHAVADIGRWIEGKAERAAAIESGSGSNVQDYVDAIKAMLASPPPDVLEKMQAHGVVPPITAYVEA